MGWRGGGDVAGPTNIVASESGGMVTEEMNADKTVGDVSDGMVTEKTNTDKADGDVSEGVNKERMCEQGGAGNVIQTKAMNECASR